MITSDSIIINEQLHKVYETACDLGKQHEFIPGYKPAEVFKEGGRTLVRRTAEVNGKLMHWTSTVTFYENRSIYFEQVEGRLKGMKIRWCFHEVPYGTKVTITHDLKLDIPVFGWLAERLLAKPTIDKLTANVLKGLKAKMESGLRDGLK